jgi:hypothetical protein
MHSSGISSADATGNYIVSDGIGTYDDLGAAFDAINSGSGTDFTVTACGDDPNVTYFELKAGKNVTLISSGGTFELTKASGRHGMVRGSLTLENLILDGNRTGGGITVSSIGILNINSGTVIQNCYTANNDGGGGVLNYGTINMYSGRISYNSSGCDGGGVSNTAGGVLNMSGNAVISNNSATSTSDSAYGGGVLNHSSSVLNMSGNAVISNNSVTSTSAAAFGGGVSNIRSTLNMSGNAVITNNSNTSNPSKIGGGGGVANLYESTFTMSGKAVISGNEAMYYGGGVFTWNYSTFTMSGNAAIVDNTVLNPASAANRYGGGVANHTATFDMTGNAVISGNKANHGAGVFNIDGTFSMFGDATISNNNATSRAGGVYNNSLAGGSLVAVFNMSDNAAIHDNAVTAGDFCGGGMVNSSRSVFNMSGNAAICHNTVISGAAANTQGGGVYNFGNGTINMSGGEICYNSAARGGGITNAGTFSMYGGAISGNTADYGGGAYNGGLFDIAGGMIVGNTANKNDSKGSGGGIYTTNFANLKVADGVVFSGNTASTLRTTDIAADADIDGNGTPDPDDYKSSIGTVKLDALVNQGQNAPAYNNFDINYPGSEFAVYIDIEPNGAGKVTVTDSGSGAVYGTLTDDGYVCVPDTATSITLSATSGNGYEFKQFIIDGMPAGDDDSIAVPISGNMSVVAEFTLKSIPQPPGSKRFFISTNADSGSTITPNGTVEVQAGGDRAFKFSAKSGYMITAVYVDGVAITSAELESGTYTFYGVRANHIISVVSKTDGGDSGEEETIGKEGNGGGGGRGSDGQWAVLNMIFATLAVFAGMIAIIGGKGGFKSGNAEKKLKAAVAFRILALLIGIVSAMIFFLTENLALAAKAVDEWSPIMFVLLVVALVMTMASFRFDNGSADGMDNN